MKTFPSIIHHGSVDRCFGLNSVHPPPGPTSYVVILTHGASESDLIWKRGHCRYNQLR